MLCHWCLNIIPHKHSGYSIQFATNINSLWEIRTYATTCVHTCPGLIVHSVRVWVHIFRFVGGADDCDNLLVCRVNCFNVFIAGICSDSRVVVVVVSLSTCRSMIARDWLSHSSTYYHIYNSLSIYYSVCKWKVSDGVRVALLKILGPKIPRPKKLVVIITDPKLLNPKIPRPKYWLQQYCVFWQVSRANKIIINYFFGRGIFSFWMNE